MRNFRNKTSQRDYSDHIPTSVGFWLMMISMKESYNVMSTLASWISNLKSKNSGQLLALVTSQIPKLHPAKGQGNHLSFLFPFFLSNLNIVWVSFTSGYRSVATTRANFSVFGLPSTIMSWDISLSRKQRSHFWNMVKPTWGLTLHVVCVCPILRENNVHLKEPTGALQGTQNFYPKFILHFFKDNFHKEASVRIIIIIIETYTSIFMN